MGMRWLTFSWPDQSSQLGWREVPSGTRYLVYTRGPAPSVEVRQYGHAVEVLYAKPGKVICLDPAASYQYRGYQDDGVTAFNQINGNPIPGSPWNGRIIVSDTVVPPSVGDVYHSFLIPMDAGDSTALTQVMNYPIRTGPRNVGVGVFYPGGITTGISFDLRWGTDNDPGRWTSPLQTLVAAGDRFFIFSAKEYESTNQSPSVVISAVGEWHQIILRARIDTPVSGSANVRVEITSRGDSD